MAGPTAATPADLERLKRELTARITTLEQSTNRQIAAADGSAAANLTTRRIDQLEQRVQRTIDGINTTVTSAHSADTAMTRRLDQLEQRLQRAIEGINTTVTHAHAADTAMTRRLDQIEQRLQRAIEGINTTVTHAHDADTAMARRLEALERQVAELGRDRASRS